MGYTPLRELATGGMASVMLARNNDSGDVVVIKRALKAGASEERRLVEEARIGRRLRHASIVQTLEVIELDGHPAVVLEYVRGLTMSALRGAGALPAPLVALIGAQIASGLKAIHAAVDEAGRPLRILHRDVTPANVIVGLDGRAKLIDLGIAKARDSMVTKTAEGEVRGTLRYLAPELLQETPHTPGSDLWALAIVLLEAAMGAHVFRGKNTGNIIFTILDRDPLVMARDAGVDRALIDALAPVLRRDPHDREQDAATLARALADLAAAAHADEAALAARVAAVVEDRPAPPVKAAVAPPASSPSLPRPASSSPTSLLSMPPTESGVVNPVATPFAMPNTESELVDLKKTETHALPVQDDDDGDESWSALLDARVALASPPTRAMEEPPAAPRRRAVVGPLVAAAVVVVAAVAAGAVFVSKREPDNALPVDTKSATPDKSAQEKAAQEKAAQEKAAAEKTAELAQVLREKRDYERQQEENWSKLVGDYKAMTELVPRGSSWRYLALGPDQKTAWQAASFNDARWSEGAARLGYGGDGEATVLPYGSDPLKKTPTVYFRKRFTVDARFDRAALRIARDDGAAVYLNGKEIARLDLAPGAHFDDWALDNVESTPIVDREHHYYPVLFPAKLLKRGANVIAVEVHQTRASSPDLGFDLELFGIVDAKAGEPSSRIAVAPDKPAEQPLVPDDDRRPRQRSVATY